MTEVTLIQPDPRFITVHYSPSYEHGDCVSIQLDDPDGRFLIVVSPEVAEHISTLLMTAVKSPRIGAIADQIRTEQRENGR